MGNNSNRSTHAGVFLPKIQTWDELNNALTNIFDQIDSRIADQNRRTSDFDMNGNRIVRVGDPGSGDAAVNLRTVQDLVKQSRVQGTQPARTVAVSSAEKIYYGTATTDLSLTTSYQDIAGATVTVNRSGTYKVTACFEFNITAGDTGAAIDGQLLVNGSAQTIFAVAQAPAGTIELSTFQQWVVTGVLSGQVLKLQAKKAAGSGTSSVIHFNTTIIAEWIE